MSADPHCGYTPPESLIATCSDCETALTTVGGLREGDDPQPATVWHYIGKRERVHVRRVWTGFPPVEDCVAVRCHPLHGGRSWTAPLCEFIKRFRPEVDGA